MATKALAAETRIGEKGKNVSGRLRVSGYIPAVMYAHGKSDPVKVKAKDFYALFRGHISESVIIDLSIAGEKEPHQVFVKDYQRDPITDLIVHLDFYKITAGEKIHTMVPVEVTGYAVGMKKGGVVTLVEKELEVRVLPRELPEKIVIDVTKLDIGESVRIKDIKIADSLTFSFDPEHIIVHVVVPKAEAEVAEVVEGAVAAEAPVAEKK
jgi:large subunit ribosomal protein L25